MSAMSQLDAETRGLIPRTPTLTERTARLLAVRRLMAVTR